MAVVQGKSKLVLGSYVNWNEAKEIVKLRKQINKQLRKVLKSKKVRNNRINTFSVTEIDFEMNVDVLSRLELEETLQRIFKSYAVRIEKKKTSRRSQNSDIQIYVDTFKKGGFDLQFQVENVHYQTLNGITVKIDGLIAHSNVVIWTLENGQEDKVIIDKFVANVPKNSSNGLDDSIDELLVTNLAKEFLPYTLMLIEQVFNVYQKVDRFVEGMGLVVSESIKSLVPTLIGTISGLQESLKLLERQVKRLDVLAQETVTELELFGSQELNEWLAMDYQGVAVEIFLLLEQLHLRLADLKQNMRRINYHSRPGEIGFLHLLIEMRSYTAGLRLWIHSFADLPSFTTSAKGIAYEEVEDEEYKSVNGHLIETSRLFKNFYRGQSTIYALRGVEININKGDFTIIKGPSGSGKTTLLNLLAGLENANRGAVFFDGEDLLHMRDGKRTKIRRNNFGFIFQSYALIPHLTSFENTKLPTEISGLSKNLVDRIQGLLDDVGIGQFANHKPALLSGGQMQRLGIARALINRPAVIFADEPTGDLDRKTSTQVMELLKQYHQETGTTIVLVTHDDEVAQYGSRKIYLRDGQVVHNQN